MSGSAIPIKYQMLMEARKGDARGGPRPKALLTQTVSDYRKFPIRNKSNKASVYKCLPSTKLSREHTNKSLGGTHSSTIH